MAALTFDEIAAVDHGFVRMFDLNIKTWSETMRQCEMHETEFVTRRQTIWTTSVLND